MFLLWLYKVSPDALRYVLGPGDGVCEQRPGPHEVGKVFWKVTDGVSGNRSSEAFQVVRASFGRLRFETLGCADGARVALTIRSGSEGFVNDAPAFRPVVRRSQTVCRMMCFTSLPPTKFHVNCVRPAEAALPIPCVSLTGGRRTRY